MIFGFLRLAALGFVGLTVIYWLLSVYSRSVRRETLEKAFDAGDVTEEDAALGRDAYIAAGMAEYEGGLRKKLLWLVYIVPAIVFAVLFYVLNFG